MNGKPRPAFFAVMFLVVAALLYVGFSRFTGRSLLGRTDSSNLSKDELAKMKGGPEAPDAGSVTTVKEYNYVAGSKLPDVKGTSAYTPLVDNTVRMALNVWAGWAPVILANNGFKPGKVWKTADGKDSSSSWC